MRAVEDVASFPGSMLVDMGSVCHLLCHAAISYKTDQARGEGDVCKPLARFAVRAISRPLAIRTSRKIRVGADKATARIRATVVEFWLKSSKKCDTGAHFIESRK
jgi:hypothetical protein